MNEATDRDLSSLLSDLEHEIDQLHQEIQWLEDAMDEERRTRYAEDKQSVETSY